MSPEFIGTTELIMPGDPKPHQVLDQLYATARGAIETLTTERDEAIARADEAEREADDANGRLEQIEHQLSAAREQIEALKTQLASRPAPVPTRETVHYDGPKGWYAALEPNEPNQTVSWKVFTSDHVSLDRTGISGIRPKKIAEDLEIENVIFRKNHYDTCINLENGPVGTLIQNVVSEGQQGYGAWFGNSQGTKIRHSTFGDSTREHCLRGGNFRNLLIAYNTLENLDLRPVDPHNVGKSCIWAMDGDGYQGDSNVVEGAYNLFPLDKGRDFDFEEGGEYDWRLGGEALERFKARAATYQLNNVTLRNERVLGPSGKLTIGHRTHHVTAHNIYVEAGIVIADEDSNEETRHLYDDPASDVHFTGTTHCLLPRDKECYGIIVAPRVKDWSIEHLLCEITAADWRAPGYNAVLFKVPDIGPIGRLTVRAPAKYLRDELQVCEVGQGEWGDRVWTLGKLKQAMGDRLVLETVA